MFRSFWTVIFMALLITVPWFAFGLFIWGLYFVSLVVLLGITETYSVKHYGKTISRLFWEFKSKNPKKAYLIGGSLTVAWGILMLHLFT